MASAFLGKYASITAVDLIQRKKLNFRNFYESNLTEARFDRSIRIITVGFVHVSTLHRSKYRQALQHIKQML